MIEGNIANAGAVSLIISGGELSHSEWIDVDFPVSPGTIALRVMGDSMEPEFIEGETVVVDPAVFPTSGDYVIAEVEDDAGHHAWTFKQFRHRGDHDGKAVFDLVPINPLYKTITVGLEIPGHVIGTMVEYRHRPFLHKKRG